MDSRSLIQPARTLADLVIAPRVGGCRDGASLHLHLERFGVRDTDTLGNRLGRGAVVALERELGDRSAGMTLSSLSCLLIRPVPPCRRAPVSST
jgi:hypothetical protein